MTGIMRYHTTATSICDSVDGCGQDKWMFSSLAPDEGTGLDLASRSLVTNGGPYIPSHAVLFLASCFKLYAYHTPCLPSTQMSD
jgi:hypothetical protein